MFPCDYCLRPLRNDAIFCDRCGHFLGPWEAHAPFSHFQLPRSYTSVAFDETESQTNQTSTSSPESRAQQIMLLLSQIQSLLNRFKFLNVSVTTTEIAERANEWLKDAEERGDTISRYDNMVYSVGNFEPLFLIQQAHDAYVLGLLDAVPVLCRTALEEELSIRYLVESHLIQSVAAGNPFKKLVDGTTDATLETLIQWATNTTPPILSVATTPLARDIQKAGNDYAHAYAMRRAGRSMSGSGNVFTNTTAIEIYEKTLKVITQMP